eukprot:7541224-Pyramimonas_sp.AAC.1
MLLESHWCCWSGSLVGRGAAGVGGGGGGGVGPALLVSVVLHWCCWSGSLVGRGAAGLGGGAVGVGLALQESVAVQL